MAYIGKTPTIGNFQVCDAISVVNNQAAYTMKVDTVNVSPESANHMIVSLNGVIQKPTDAYTVSSSTITFASNLVTGDVINFIQILGSVLDLGVPSDSTVSLAKLTATGTKNSTTFLRGDNTFDTPPLGGITEADQWRLTANFTGDANPLSSNLERVDTSGWGKLGTGMSVSSGIFTFPSTGVWLVQFRLNTYKNAQNLYAAAGIQVTTNNSSYANIAYGEQGITNAGLNVYANTLVETLIDCTDTSNVKVKFVIDNENDSTNVVGHSSVTYTSMMFIRLGDT